MKEALKSLLSELQSRKTLPAGDPKFGLRARRAVSQVILGPKKQGRSASLKAELRIILPLCVEVLKY